MKPYRRVVQRILNTIGMYPSRTQNKVDIEAKVVDAESEGPSGTHEVRDMRLLEASTLWQQGSKEDAFDVLRRARLEYGATAELQFKYGKWAYAEGHIWAAREALHDAVKLDPTHLDALELFLEANQIFPAAKGAATRALSMLAALLPHSPSFDHDAAALLVPSVSMVEIVDQKVRMLRYSKNPVAEHLGTLAVTPSENWGPLSDSNPLELREAQLVVALSRREYDLAYRLLESVPVEAKPRRALRLAIRKELRNGQNQDARFLLEHYREVDPEDAWSHRQLQAVKNTNPYLSNYELTVKGFPLPARKSAIQYEPNHSRVFYLLHTALPLHSVGYATRTHGLLRGIRKHGWDVQGVTRLGYPYDMPQMESLGDIESTVVIDEVPYHRLSAQEGFEKKSPIQGYISRYSEELQALSMERKPFILHAASNHWNGLAAVTAARKMGIPSIYEVRGLWEITRGSRSPAWMGGPMYRYMARLETDAANNSDRIITITHALQDELISRGVNRSKITVVPNGVDTSRFKPTTKDPSLVRRLNLQDKTVIGYVGSVLDYEGIGLLIGAAYRLRRERNDVAFLIVGDGAELDQFQQEIKREGLDDTVFFTGRVPHHEVEKYYSVIDICPFPRLPLPVTEMVSPLKPFEAMAMAKAVVASDVLALKEIVSDGENGLLFKKGDVESLTQQLRTLLNDRCLRGRLAMRGREWVVRERDWSVLAKKVGEVYSTLGGALR